MRKNRAAAYVAALASMLAVLAESAQERDVSSTALVAIGLAFLAVLFLTEPER